MLELIPETHTYVYDGREIPGCTRCLDVSGLIDFSYVREEILMSRSELGVEAHLANQYFTEGTLDESTVDPQVRPYVESLRKLWAKVKFKARMLEHQCVGTYNGLVYGMRADFEGIIFEREAVLDMKIGQPHWSHGVQLAGYAVGLPHAMLTTPLAKFLRRKRYGIYLQKDGSIADLKEYKNPRDLLTFGASLEITSRKLLEGVKVRRLDDVCSQIKGDDDQC